jgi:hypothetical protein
MHRGAVVLFVECQALLSLSSAWGEVVVDYTGSSILARLRVATPSAPQVARPLVDDVGASGNTNTVVNEQLLGRGGYANR